MTARSAWLPGRLLGQLLGGAVLVLLVLLGRRGAPAPS